jgi:hypothetical protein
MPLSSRLSSRLSSILSSLSIKEKYAALNAEAAKKAKNNEKPIRNRFKYFLKMLEDDAFQPAAY